MGVEDSPREDCLDVVDAFDRTDQQRRHQSIRLLGFRCLKGKASGRNLATILRGKRLDHRFKQISM